MYETMKSLTSQMAAGGILYQEALHEFRRHFVTAVLLRHQGNICRAAKELKLHRNTASRQVTELGIDLRAIRKLAKAQRKPVQAEPGKLARKVSA